jgi:DNA-binding LacI/PurR family transcriptional regulator/DNA-binding transcriptional regulator YhcF (GntR family)
MKSRAKNPALQLSLSFVEDNLTKGIWQKGERLPTVRDLAASGSVSVRTMMRAVAILKSKGLLSGVERGRLIAGDSTFNPLPPANSPMSGWRQKRAAMEKDILSGIYAKHGRLPSSKELQIRYGACFRTIQKVLQSLAADNVVHQVNKKYELSNVSGSVLRDRIVFISPNTQARPLSALNQGQNRLFDMLESECHRERLKFEFVGLNAYDYREIRRTAQGTSIAMPALGYILDLWWAQSEESKQLLQYLISLLLAFKKPVAILDEIGEFVLPVSFSGNPLIQVFRIEGKSAGARIARMLIGMKHRSVAYISTYPNASWSRQRLAGVIDEYAKAGLANGVVPIVGKQTEINHEYVLAISGFGEALMRRILGANVTKNEIVDKYKNLEEYMKTFSPGQFGPEDIRTIQERLKIIKSMDNLDITEELFNTIVNNVFADIATQINLKTRAQLFSEALAHPEATAWICGNDNIALTALSFLREKNIAVPKNISIVGFDNTPVYAIEHMLTTFDFNAYGFIHRMLYFINHPRRSTYHHSAIEIEGMVIERKTTALPPSG